MSQELINHNPQLKKLVEEGFSLLLTEGFLVVNDIPYLNKDLKISYGAFIDPLNTNGTELLPPRDHTLHFRGDCPCNKGGNEIKSIINSQVNKNHTSTLKSNFYLSSKPDSGRYENYYEKIKTYFKIITGPVKSLHPDIIKKGEITFSKNDNVFKYSDTNTTRADIKIISDKLNNYKVAILGSGGTGSYILDLLAKTPVKEIHLFDDDDFLQHNAFRAPGAFSIEVINQKLKKVDVFKDVYSNIKENIFAHSIKVTDKELSLLKEFDFVFISLDTGKKEIVSYLSENNIPFIDTGIGVNIIGDSLGGAVKVVYSDEENTSHLKHHINYTNQDENLYETNIQIVELNSIAASLAVYRWKCSLGFYSQQIFSNVLTFNINTGGLCAEHKS